MTLHVYRDLEQGSDEWYAARRGIVTASVVGRLLTSTLRVAENDQSRGLTYTLAAERITGHIDDTYSSDRMQYGTCTEPLAVDLYSRHHAPVDHVGLMVRDLGGFSLGYSPDGLVGDVGAIEVKSRLQKIHLRTILEDRVPAENMAQIQAGLLVSNRAWVDYVSYCGVMPLWTKRVYPDKSWHTAILAAVEVCETNIADAIERFTAAASGLPATERVDFGAEIEF